MNKYKLRILINNKFNIFNTRFVDVFVETNLQLDETFPDQELHEKNWSESLKMVVERLDIKIGLNEIVCNIAVFKVPDISFQKIVIEEEPKKFRLPEKYDVYSLGNYEYLIQANDHEYLFNSRKNTIKKLKLKYNLPDNTFRFMLDINRILKDVKYID